MQDLLNTLLNIKTKIQKTTLSENLSEKKIIDNFLNSLIIKELVIISKELNKILSVECEKLGVEVNDTSFIAYTTIKKENLISLIKDQKDIFNIIKKINYENNSI